MYCSFCGTAVTTGLSYCNRCGAKTGETRSEGQVATRELRPESLVWAIVAVLVLGFGTITGLLAVMRNVFDFNPGLIMALTMLSFLLVIMVEAVFVWLLLRQRGGPKELAGVEDSATQSRTLDQGQVRVLAEPVPSVTEHVTRAFEPIQRERPTK